MNQIKKLTAAILTVLAISQSFCYSSAYAAPSEADGFIKTGSDVSPEMLEADFWIENSCLSYSEIMTYAQIEEWNEANEKKAETDALNFYTLDDKDEPKTLSRTELVSALDELRLPSGVLYDINGARISSGFWTEYYSLKNYEAVLEENTVMFGICCSRADLRILPYDGFACTERNNKYVDALQNSSVNIGALLIVVHESADGEWYYAYTNGCGGWIRKSSVAIAESYDEWDNYRNVSNFIIISEDETVVPLANDFSENEIHLYMGTKLGVLSIKDSRFSDNGRVPYDSYLAEIPASDSDGRLYFNYAFVPVSKASFGYLDYTSRNVLELAFKNDGNRYGWGGANADRDCSQFIMELFSCFGFALPRNSDAIASAPAFITDVKGLPVAKKNEALDSTEAGSLLWFPGHIMIYLGKYQGDYYVLSYTGSKLNPRGYGTEQIYSCYVCSLNTCRVNRSSWYNDLRRIVSFKPVTSE